MAAKYSKAKDFNEAALKLAGSKADTNAYVKQLKSQPATPPPVTPKVEPSPRRSGGSSHSRLACSHRPQPRLG
jgi:hypothetical protein